MKRKPGIRLETAFSGSNVHLIQARVSESFLEALGNEAQKRGQSIPELIRELLAFHLIPGTLKDKVKSGSNLEVSDRMRLEIYREVLSELFSMCNEIEEGQKILELKGVHRHFVEVVKSPYYKDLIKRMAKEVAAELKIAPLPEKDLSIQRDAREQTRKNQKQEKFIKKR